MFGDQKISFSKCLLALLTAKMMTRESNLVWSNWFFKPFKSGHDVLFFFLKIMAVKKNIEDSQGKNNYPCGQQLLIHNGKVLKDETSLVENKVTEEGFLVVMLSKVTVHIWWLLHRLYFLLSSISRQPSYLPFVANFIEFNIMCSKQTGTGYPVNFHQPLF